jgi:TonB family protein
MSQALTIRRRHPRRTPMRSLRLGEALRSGRPPARAFPGIKIKEPGRTRGRALTGAFSVLLHAAVISFLLFWAWMNPIVKENPIPVQLVKEVEKVEKEEPPPPPPLPKPKQEAAPAPRALAERRSLDFAPQAQAIRPQVINPTVITPAAPLVSAQKVDMSAVAQVVAPKDISHATVVAEHVSAVSSVASAQVSKVDLGSAAAPALRGPTDASQPVGPSAGPHQITDVGSTMGTGPATATGVPGGSSVREGIASNRDVLGSPSGPRVANVNTRVGEGLMHGDGGNGPGGGGDGDCFSRPEVVAYEEQIRTRMYARWILPADVPPSQEVRLQFSLDPAGSVTNVRPIGGGHPELAASAVEALRAAAPFPPMSDRVRCLSKQQLTGIFRNPLAGG